LSHAGCSQTDKQTNKRQSKQLPPPTCIGGNYAEAVIKSTGSG